MLKKIAVCLTAFCATVTIALFVLIIQKLFNDKVTNSMNLSTQFMEKSFIVFMVLTIFSALFMTIVYIADDRHHHQ